MTFLANQRLDHQWVNYRDQDFTAADDETILDFEADLGLRATEVVIIVDKGGNIEFEMSTDGISFSDREVIAAGEKSVNSGVIMSALKLFHTGVDSSYRVKVV